MTALVERTDIISPLAALVGADIRVPLVTGETVRYANLDLAASAPALQQVAERVAEILPLYSSVHRGAGYASAVCTAAYENARTDIAAFVGAREDDVVIVVRNTTDALNLLATAVPVSTGPSATAVPGQVVHLDIEHHANLLPWQGIGGRAVEARATLAETLATVEAELQRQPAALLAVTGASNVTGEVLPLAELAAIAHRNGARIAVDGAQLVPHRRIDIAELGIDYLAFSGHKLYAPFGAGVLIGRRDWLSAAPPYLAGGGAVRQVTLAGTTWGEVPARHEGGTPNVVGAVALAASCCVLAALPAEALHDHEQALLQRLQSGLAGIDGVRTLALWAEEADRIGVVGFTVDGIPAELVAQYLSAEHGIGVRDGRFCAHPFLARLTDGATAVRASIGIGSRSEDVDRLVAAVCSLREDGPRWTYADATGDYLPTPDPRPLPEWVTGSEAGRSACVD
jgi:selenocysteine lyase/cysteine desulfurase